MQTMEMRSTDKRLDDLSGRVSEGFQRVDREMSEGFKRVDREVSRIDGDVRELRGDIKELHRETNERFDAVNVRFDAMHRTMMRGFFALGGLMVTLFLALAGLQGF
jgi:chromosome segregation ATPase